MERKCIKHFKKINSKLPAQVDEFTTWTSASCSGGYNPLVQLKYKLNSNKLKQEFNLSKKDSLLLYLKDMAPSQRQSVLDLICNNKKGDYFFIKRIEYEYIYYLDTGERAFLFSVTKNDCS